MKLHDTDDSSVNGVLLAQKVLRSLDIIDDMDPETRALVHEFGWIPVSSMLNLNLTPGQMRSVINACWLGSAERHQRPPRLDGGSSIFQFLDGLLYQSGSCLSAHMLLCALRRFGMTIVPIKPNPVMVNASMETVSRGDAMVTKSRKHTLRLEAAIKAVSKRLWPMVFSDDV